MGRQIVKIPIDSIDRDETQPRKLFPDDELKAMALNIETVGLQDPIHVSPHPEKAGRYILFDGECRLRAHKISEKLMGIGTIEAIIKENDSEGLSEYEQGRRHAMQTAKNSVRIQMSFIERADSYRVSKEKGVTTKELANIHGLPEKTIIRDIAISEMPESVRKAVNDGQCPIAVAEKILETFPADSVRQAIAWERASAVRNTKEMSAVIMALKSDVDQKPIFEVVAEAKKNDQSEYASRIREARKDWDAMKAVFARLKKWADEDGVGFFADAVKKDSSVEETLKAIKKASEALSEGLTLKNAQSGKLNKAGKSRKKAA